MPMNPKANVLLIVALVLLARGSKVRHFYRIRRVTDKSVLKVKQFIKLRPCTFNLPKETVTAIVSVKVISIAASPKLPGLAGLETLK